MRKALTPSPFALGILCIASLVTLACGSAMNNRTAPEEPAGAGGDTGQGGMGGSAPVRRDSGPTPDRGGTGGTSPDSDAAARLDTARVDTARVDTASIDTAAGDRPPSGPDVAAAEAGVPLPDTEKPLPPCARTVMAANSAELAARLGGARPGDCILLADSDYTFPTITNTATAAAPVVVRAQNRGQAKTGAIVFSKAAHVVLEGLTMVGLNIKILDSAYCRISRFRFQVQETTDNDWIQLSGTTHHTRIDHNDLGPKNVIGNMVMFSGGPGAQVVQYNRVDHNYFHDVKGGGGNGWESIRLGLSGLAASKGFNVVEYNLFRAATGDPEIVSVKSADNIVRYNTFRASRGEITLRHGNRTLVYGNFMFADGLAEARGIRVCGSQHRIFNNYLEGIISGAGIFLEGGDADGGPGDIPGGAHFRVYSAHVVNNTIVNGRGIVVGGAHPFAPVGCVVANNLVQSPSRGAGIIETAGENMVYEGNISSAGAGPGTTVADPKLVNMNGVFRLAAGSPAIDSAAGNYPYVTDDMDGQPRVKADVGADELATGPTRRRPLTAADVGPDAP